MNKHKVTLIVLMFLLIYTPPIIGINTLHVLGAISWLYIVINWRLVKKTIKIKHTINLYIVLIIILIYVLLVTVFNNVSILPITSYLYWLVDIIPVCILLSTCFAKHCYEVEDVVNILLIVGIIQGVLALLSFLNPSIQLYFVEKLVSHGHSEIYLNLIYKRMYGFASNLTFTTPIVQSVFTIMALYLAVNKNWKYILLTPLLVFSAIINARISILIIILGFFIIILKKFNLKKMLTIVLLIVFFILMTANGMKFLEHNAIYTYDWIIEGYKEIIMFINGDTSYGYFNYLVNPYRHQLPEGLGLVFGKGERIMSHNSYNVYSDIGYVNDIWLGGIIYMLLIYSLFIKLLYGLYKAKKDKFNLSSFMFYFYAGVILIGNIKGYIINPNNFTNLVFICFVFIVLVKSNVKPCNLKNK